MVINEASVVDLTAKLLFLANEDEDLALLGIALFNKSIEGTRRPLMILALVFYQGSAASFKLTERRRPYRKR
ncbi:hypothetical protein [Methylobacter sp. BBA5.1]|uniref:hypothetical protein n=1 Tax=Methylobacter sp. BBA5.1 TaxID=1495064 RepID=UPI00056D443D|nr:hypothetical protein [Methylobacter sp. BBA5.1]